MQNSKPETCFGLELSKDSVLYIPFSSLMKRPLKTKKILKVDFYPNPNNAVLI